MPTRPLLLALALFSKDPIGFDDEEAARMFHDALLLKESKAYADAARMLEDVFDRVPEDGPYRGVRETVALNVLDAYLSAYREDGETVHLHRARAFRERYQAAIEAAYPGQDVTTADVRAKSEALDAALAELAKTYEFTPCLTVIAPEPEPTEPPVGPCLSPPSPCLQPIEPKRGCGDDGDPGLAAALLLPLGLRRRRDVLDRLADRLPADVLARLKAKLDDEA